MSQKETKPSLEQVLENALCVENDLRTALIDLAPLLTDSQKDELLSVLKEHEERLRANASDPESYEEFLAFMEKMKSLSQTASQVLEDMETKRDIQTAQTHIDSVQ